MTRGRSLTALIATIALTGCAARVAPAAPGPPAADLVLRERLIVDFLSPQARFTTLPIISVYGDGRVITTGPQPEFFPGPALPRILIQNIPPSDVRRLLDLAAKAGVGSGADLGSPMVTDAPSTRFTLRTDDRMVETTAYALDEDGDTLTPAQHAARAALRVLDRSLRDLRATLGSVPPPAAYDPVGVAVIAQDWVDRQTPSPSTPPAIAWPGPALPGQYLGDGLTCVAASGATADAVFAAAARANAGTPWTFDGRRWMLSLRPLLPDEDSCGDIIG